MRSTLLTVLVISLSGCSASQAPRASTAEPTATPTPTEVTPSAPTAPAVGAPAATAPAVQTLSASEFRAMRQTHPEYVLLDVRTPPEFESGHLEGAKLMDFRAPDFERKLTSLDPLKTYLIYCRTGHRSGLACERFGQHSIRAYNMAGGITAWRADGQPTTTASSPSR